MRPIPYQIEVAVPGSIETFYTVYTVDWLPDDTFPGGIESAFDPDAVVKPSNELDIRTEREHVIPTEIEEEAIAYANRYIEARSIDPDDLQWLACVEVCKHTAQVIRRIE